jgi:hypothetical protein
VNSGGRVRAEGVLSVVRGLMRCVYRRLDAACPARFVAMNVMISQTFTAYVEVFIDTNVHGLLNLCFFCSRL